MSENSILAPDTNRGAVNTIVNELNQRILVDWCQFSIFYSSEKNTLEKSEILNIKNFAYQLFIELFKVNPNDLIFENIGINGYSASLSYKDIYAYFSPDRLDMGVNFKLSGCGCRNFEDLNLTWIQLFKKINEYKHNYNRIDIAIDDFTNHYFTIEKLQKWIRKGRVVSKFKSSLDIIKRNILDGSILGNTLQFGSKASRVQITFYNKMLERQSQNYIIDNNIESWIRTEIRFRNERADEISKEIIHNANFNALIKGILANYISFLIPSSTDSNKSRWSIAPWWSAYLQRVGKVQLTSINIESNLIKKKEWLHRTVSRSQFQVFVANLDNIDSDCITTDYIREILLDGCKRINDKDLQMINDYRLKHNLPLITHDQIRALTDNIKEVLILNKELPF